LKKQFGHGARSGLCQSQLARGGGSDLLQASRWSPGVTGMELPRKQSIHGPDDLPHSWASVPLHGEMSQFKETFFTSAFQDFHHEFFLWRNFSSDTTFPLILECAFARTPNNLKSVHDICVGELVLTGYRLLPMLSLWGSGRTGVTEI
jgi:hypothetical protein